MDMTDRERFSMTPVLSTSNCIIGITLSCFSSRNWFWSRALISDIEAVFNVWVEFLYNQLQSHDLKVPLNQIVSRHILFKMFWRTNVYVLFNAILCWTYII